MTRPIFCTNPSERVYITAWGCEIGSGRRNGLQAPRRRGPVIQRRVRSPGPDRVYERTARGSKQKRVMVYGSSCLRIVSTQSPRLAPRWVGDFAENPALHRSGRGGGQRTCKGRTLPGPPTGGRNPHGGGASQPGSRSDGGELPIDERGCRARRGGHPSGGQRAGRAVHRGGVPPKPDEPMLWDSKIFGVAKNLIARVSILARFSGPSRGRFRHGHNLYLLAMTVAVVSEVQVPKNGCFIAAEGVPGVTPGWSHTDP